MSAVWGKKRQAGLKDHRMPPNFKEVMIKLVDLQKIDKAIYALKRELEGAPARLAEIDARFEELKTQLKSLEENRQKLMLEQKKKEGELAALEDNIKKASGQLGQLKTNKEYQAKMAEIEGSKADKSVVEEDVLKLMDAVEATKPAIEAGRQRLAQEEKKFAQERAVIQDRLKQIEAEIQLLEGKRVSAAADVDKLSLKHYEHILHGRGGIAIVPVTDNSCQGCHMHIPHQVINEIRMHERLINCETCSCILYLEDDVNAA